MTSARPYKTPYPTPLHPTPISSFAKSFGKMTEMKDFIREILWEIRGGKIRKLSAGGTAESRRVVAPMPPGGRNEARRPRERGRGVLAEPLGRLAAPWRASRSIGSTPSRVAHRGQSCGQSRGRRGRSIGFTLSVPPPTHGSPRGRGSGQRRAPRAPRSPPGWRAPPSQERKRAV